MKRLLGIVIALGTVVMFSLAGCGDSAQAGIRITSPDGDEVAFSGYYESDLTEQTQVDGVTKASYKVDVYRAGDNVRASFVKTDTADDVSELNIKLYYRGLMDEVTVTVPGDSATVTYQFSK